ncbi:MAG: ATP-binding protein [Alphaproteobacteria bacterium]|nr:ATP-binding protein [Alphaproteobacteria bacterium]
MLTESVRQKWDAIVNHEALPEIKDNYRKTVTTILLENQERALLSENGVAGTQLGTPNAGAGTTNGIDAFDPILISLVRRSMPNLMAYDIAGVQPMNGPTGLIFAMKTRYTNRDGVEALYNEADTGFSTKARTTGSANQTGNNSTAAGSNQKHAGTMGDIFAGDAAGGSDFSFETATGMPTTTAETLGGDGGAFNKMSFTIEKTAVTARSRALQAEYTTELAQDLKAVHGLDAETELANILSTEILFEINRELVRTIYQIARLGCQQADLNGKASGKGLNANGGGGVYDLELDSDGRWSAEKFRGLTFQLEREANVVGAETRRGKANFAIVSPDVAAALSMSGLLDFSPAFSGGINTDVNGNSFAGTLHQGRIKVYVDPYSMPTNYNDFTPVNYVCVGYKGTSPYDAGVFYCPYVPLQMVRAVDTSTFQPKIGFKTRYGMVSNPFVMSSTTGTGAPDGEKLTPRVNQYYRIFRVDNLHGNDASFG